MNSPENFTDIYEANLRKKEMLEDLCLRAEKKQKEVRPSNIETPKNTIKGCLLEKLLGVLSFKLMLDFDMLVLVQIIPFISS